ncbi:hypothetical protein QBC34DRAFT_429881 [Podospora aff. communis PSN243]|uniref:Uncharacterized protein n=1 Tax=Podospora aff. communis PSN243 TaxID=3040156 RepID=A0AAV9G8W5_9PEZI|nr:hypothetical protein QBC34DRAFT_429881 [Podospora aff. communis PSN243]
MIGVVGLVDSECTKKEKDKLWRNTVYNYAERALTVWTDCLPALSGLATEFLTPSKEPTPDDEVKQPFKGVSLGTYLAGIWSSTLPLGLGCYAPPNPPGKRLSTVASHYIALSWPWASVSGNVNWDTTRCFEPLAEILHAQSTLAGTSETGSVSAGEVRLRAMVISLKLYYGDVEIPRTDGERYTYMHLQARDPLTGKVAPSSMYLPDYLPPRISRACGLGAEKLEWGGA